MRLQSFIRE